MNGRNPALLEQLKALLGPAKLKDMMERLSLETGGLLDDETTIALIMDELGMTGTPFSALAELTEGKPVFTRCSIMDIDNTREFRGRERTGKLRKLRVTDASAELVLTLWDEETGLVEQLGLKPGSCIRVLGAQLRSTRFGQEIHVGKSGFIVLDEETGKDPLSEKRDISEISGAVERVDVKGVILSLSSAGRGRQKTTTIRLFDGTGECDIIMPYGTVETPAGLEIGVELEFTKAKIERRNDRMILYCDHHSTMRII